MTTSRTAIVLGASMSGLLAARALVSSFDRVLIVERDRLEDGTGLRKGVPQAAHAHGLLASGFRAIDRFFPGLVDELAAEGAWVCDGLGNCYLHNRYHSILVHVEAGK